MDPVIQRLDSIEAKLDRVLFPQAISLAGVMHLTGCKSYTAQNRWNNRYGLKPYVHGKYRRREVENLIAHLRLVQPDKVKNAPTQVV